MSAIANNPFGGSHGGGYFYPPVSVMSIEAFLGAQAGGSAGARGSIAPPLAVSTQRPICSISYEETDDPVQILNENGFLETDIYDRRKLQEALDQRDNLSPISNVAVREIIACKSNLEPKEDEEPLCPITQEVPRNPVQIKNSNGVLEPAIYDRAALEQWRRENNISPLTRQGIAKIVPYKKPQPVENNEHLTLGQKILKTAKKTGVTALKVLGSMALTLTCTAGYAIVGAAVGVAVLEVAAALTAVILVALVVGLFVFVIAITPPSELVRPRPGIAPSPLPPPGPNTPLFPPGLKALPLKLAKAGAIAGAAIGAAIGLNVGIRVSKNVFWEGQDLFSEENKDIFLLRG